MATVTDEKPTAEQAEAAFDNAFIDEGTGAGFDDMNTEQLATPLLLICQTNSADAIVAGVKPGEFYDSISKKSYGTSVKMVPAYFKVAWLEWKPGGGGFVGRYEPGSVPVVGDNYTGMTRQGTQNKIVETWLYYVALADYPEDGFFIFNSTPGNMKYLKAWNTQMKFLRTPKGNPADMWKSIWEHTTALDQNKAGNKYFSCKGGIKRIGWVTKQLLNDVIEPLRITAPQIRLQISAAQASDADTAIDATNDAY